MPSLPDQAPSGLVLPGTGLMQEIPVNMRVSAAATAGLLAAQLSCELLLHDDAQLGPFMLALEDQWRAPSLSGDRETQEDAIMALPASLFDRRAIDPTLGGELYLGMDAFEFGGAEAPSTKLFAVICEGRGRVRLDQNTDHYRYLQRVMNDPERARVLFIGKNSIPGLKPLAKLARSSIILSSDGSPANFNMAEDQGSQRTNRRQLSQDDRSSSLVITSKRAEDGAAVDLEALRMLDPPRTIADALGVEQ